MKQRCAGFFFRFSVLLMLAAALCMFSVQAADAGYLAGQFSDVDEQAWYGDAQQQVIRMACERGIAQGRTDGTFGIDQPVTAAELITMAARVRSAAQRDGAAFAAAAGQAWYAPYVEYAIAQGIIAAETYSQGYETALSRGQTAQILADTLPEDSYTAINIVETLPDVTPQSDYGTAVFQLCRSGILSGDTDGMIHPERILNRQEAVALILRLADPQLRIAVQPPQIRFHWESEYRDELFVSTYESWKCIANAARENLISRYVLDMSYDLYTAYCNELAGDYGMDTRFVYSTSTGYGTMTATRHDPYSIFEQIWAATVYPEGLTKIDRSAVLYSAALDNILQKIIQPEMTDREKVTEIHHYMVLHYNYDPKIANGEDSDYGEDSFSFTGMLDHGVGVCQGYAEMFTLMCEKSGIRCDIVTGMTDSGIGQPINHAWNRVTVDGVLYDVDVTWDDPVNVGNRVYLKYFLITSRQMAADHTETGVRFGR